jgi:hypothetical protein
MGITGETPLALAHLAGQVEAASLLKALGAESE